MCQKGSKCKILDSLHQEIWTFSVKVRYYHKQVGWKQILSTCETHQIFSCHSNMYSVYFIFIFFFSELSSKLQDTLEQIEEQLDIALSKTCSKFDVAHYEKVQMAYTLLGKRQVDSQYPLLIRSIYHPIMSDFFQRTQTFCTSKLTYGICDKLIYVSVLFKRFRNIHCWANLWQAEYVLFWTSW